MKDQSSDYAFAVGLTAAVRTADATGATVDRFGYDAVTHELLVGVGGITFDATNKIEVTMEHSDDGSSWSDVTEDDVNGAESATVTSGIVKTFDEAHAAAAVYAFDYTGPKRYSRLSLDFSGTHGTGTATSAVARLGEARTSPGITTAIAG